MAKRDHRHLQQSHQASERQGTQDDRQQVKVEEGTRALPGEPQHAGDEYHHGPGFDQQPGPGAPREEAACPKQDDGDREGGQQNDDRPQWGRRRPGPNEHQGREGQAQYFNGTGTAHALPKSNRRGYRTALTDGRCLQFLNRAPHLGVSLQQRRVGGHRLSKRLRIARELAVGCDAPVIDGYSRWRVIERRGQLDGAVAGEGDDGLYRALAEYRSAHELRAVVIFEGTGDDLRRRRRSTIYQHHDRRAVECVARRRIHFKFGLRRASFRGHDDPGVEKGIGDRDGRLEHTPRIVAQVEHQPLERRRVAFAQIFECGDEVIPGGFAELGNPHVPHAGFEHFGPYAAQFDARTLEGELQRFSIAFTQNAYLDHCSFLAAHAADRVREGGRVHRNPVDRRDDIAGANPGRGRGRALERRHHHDLFVFHRHFDAHARVLART